MQDFAAIDFETANNERSSVCSVGVVIVRGGEIVNTIYKARKITFEELNRRWMDNVTSSSHLRFPAGDFVEWRRCRSSRKTLAPQGDCREDNEDVE